MDTPYPDSAQACLTLVDVLRWRAGRQPDRRAYAFLANGETEAGQLTYGELDQQARAIAAVLQTQGAAGHPVLLLYGSGLDYIAAFFGCLYAGAIAVPAYPPRLGRLRDRTLPRLGAIVKDAEPRVALTTSSILSLVEQFLGRAPDFQTLRWVATDAVDSARAAEWSNPIVQPETLAFLQYTSGSTSTPKGVMVSHANLLHNAALMFRATDLDEKTIGVSWLPLYHDMGLIGNIILSLYSGFPSILMSPVDFIQKPIRWLEAISRFHATLSGGPNFAYDLCASRITPEQLATLDLRSWNLAYNGAEPIHAETLDRFAATFERCGFRREVFFPCYGLAEATLLVSGGPRFTPPVIQKLQRTALEQGHVAAAPAETKNTVTLVGCGETWPEQRIVIVNPETRALCQPHEIGEIWIAGPCVTQGYWNHPEATERTFHAYLADTGEGPFLRTGDLGFVQNQELTVTSRLKDLIIIRGRNHAPQDIEQTAEQSHPALRPGCGIAFLVNRTGGPQASAGMSEQLAIVHEVERHYQEVDVEEVGRAIRQAVAENHDLHVYAIVLIKTGTLPKTSSGKLQRHACRAEFLGDTLEKLGSSIVEELEIQPETAPADDQVIQEIRRERDPVRRYQMLLSYLQRQLARALGGVTSPLGPDEPFTTLGLDSLKAFELKNRIETDLGVQVPLVSFLEQPTLSQLARVLVKELSLAEGREIFALDGQLIADTSQLLARLDQLSSAQVDSLLRQLEEER